MIALPVAASCAHVHVHLVRLARGRPEVPVQIVPAAQHEADRLQLGNVVRLVDQIRDAHLDVHDRLGRQTRHRGGAHVLDAEHGRAQRSGHPLPPAFVGLRPGRVIVDDDQRHPGPLRTLGDGEARPRLRHRLPGQAEPRGRRQLVRGQALGGGD